MPGPVRRVFHFLFEVTPAAGSEHFGTAGGAFVSCWVRASGRTQAEARASRYIGRQGWDIVSLEAEDRPEQITYQDTPESQQLYERAQETGEAYLFYTWPPGPQADDSLQ